MVTLEANADRRGGVTLVTATLAGGDRPARVTIENRLDGPIWPPRRQGEPEAGWDVDAVDGFRGIVPAERRLAIGYASPADPLESPLEVTNCEPLADDVDDPEPMTTPAAVVRGLGDPSPPGVLPRAAVEESPVADVGGHDGARTAANDATAREPAAETAATVIDATTDEAVDEPAGGPIDDVDDPPLPPALSSWLTTVERRLDRAEALRADAPLEHATAAIRACGGIEGVRALDSQVAIAERQLRTLERRAGALADRAGGTTVVTDALDRLA